MTDAGSTTGAEKVRRWIPGAVALGSAAGTFAGVKMLAEVPLWVQNLITVRGLDYIFSFAILGMVVYLGPRFIKSQEAQAVALTSLSDSVKNLPQKDSMKFDEIIIGQQMVHNEIKRLHDRFDSMESSRGG